MRLMVNLGLDVREKKMAAHSLSVNLKLNIESENTSGGVNVHEEL